MINSIIQLLPRVEAIPGGSEGKECACNAEDLGSIPGLGRSLGEGRVTALLSFRIFHILEN